MLSGHGFAPVDPCDVVPRSDTKDMTVLGSESYAIEGDPRPGMSLGQDRATIPSEDTEVSDDVNSPSGCLTCSERSENETLLPSRVD